MRKAVLSMAIVVAALIAVLGGGLERGAWAQSGTPAPEGLISWWQGENNADDSADGNDGALVGGGYMQGPVEQAFSLDGGGYVDIGDRENLNFGTGDFTVQFWAKTTQAPKENDQKVFVNKQTSLTPEGRTGFEIFLASPFFVPQIQGTVIFVIRDGVNGAGVVSRKVINDGDWHHVAAVKTAKSMFLCVDGVFQGAKLHSVTGSISTETSFRMGELSDRTTGSHEFLGGLDEIAVHNRALSPGELECGGESTVDIDIKPGGSPNSINPGNLGNIPVAILSSASFSAPSSVDVSSLRFGRTGYEESLLFCNVHGEDVDGDGILDLVCHFDTQKTPFEKGDSMGFLTGATNDGLPLFGIDSVRIVR